MVQYLLEYVKPTNNPVPVTPEQVYATFRGFTHTTACREGAGQCKLAEHSGSFVSPKAIQGGVTPPTANINKNYIIY